MARTIVQLHFEILTVEVMIFASVLKFVDLALGELNFDAWLCRAMLCESQPSASFWTGN
jgi:hypothetical protein